MIKNAVERIVIIAREEGLGAMLRKVMSAGGRFLCAAKTGPDAFDQALKLDTAGQVPLWKLNISSTNAKFGTHYQTVPPTEFLDVLKLIPAEARNSLFIDLGSGKGRILILAAQEGFRKVMGVEFSSELAAIARQNARIAGITAEVREADASGFSFPNEALVIYMYNPFTADVMKPVVNNLLEWGRTMRKTAYVLYLNPVYSGLFQASAEFKFVGELERAKVWKLN